MSKIKVIAILTVLILCLGVFAVQAETEPEQTPVTQPIIATTPVQSQPDVTEPAPSQPVGTNPTAPTSPTGTSQPASGIEGTTPSGATQPTSEYTEPTTIFVRPTEIVTEPSTYSNYVSPAPIYTPGNQDYNKKEWENIELDLSGDKNPGGSGGSFLNIKNNNSLTDEKNPLFLILAIVFWFLALSAVTFLILYRPEKKVACAKNSFDKKQEKKRPEKSPKYERKYSDDYNDGF